MKRNIKRIFHNHEKWEEYHYGMWKSIFGEEREKLTKEAVKFTGDANTYGAWMKLVIDKWPYSCEHNLTCLDMNRQAWIGHAAVCLALGIPEDITRIAWHQLTQSQQDAANKKADEAISLWEEKHCQKDIYQQTFFHLLENA